MSLCERLGRRTKMANKVNLRELVLEERTGMLENLLGFLYVDSGSGVLVVPGDQKVKTAASMRENPQEDDEICLIFVNNQGAGRLWEETRSVTWESVVQAFTRVIDWIKKQSEKDRASGESGRFKTAFKKTASDPLGALQTFINLCRDEETGVHIELKSSSKDLAATPIKVEGGLQLVVRAKPALNSNEPLPQLDPIRVADQNLQSLIDSVEEEFLGARRK